METTNQKSVLTLDKKNKILLAVLKGFFRPDDANYFVEEYNKNLKEIDAKEYEFYFNLKDMKVSSQDMLPMLSACFEMYKRDNFKKVVFDCGGTTTLKLQIHRVAEQVGLASYEVI